MAANSDDPTALVACADPQAPDINGSSCEAELHYGLISNLYITTQDPTAVFSAAPTATEIETRLALPLTDPKAMRLLIGEMTFGTANAQTEPFNGRNVPKPGTRDFPVETKDTSDKNYEFMRQTENGGYPARVYGVSSDGKFWFGGQNGIFGTLQLGYELGTDFSGVHKIKGTLSTRSQFSPKRIASPVPAV